MLIIRNCSGGLSGLPLSYREGRNVSPYLQRYSARGGLLRRGQFYSSRRPEAHQLSGQGYRQRGRADCRPCQPDRAPEYGAGSWHSAVHRKPRQRAAERRCILHKHRREHGGRRAGRGARFRRDLAVRLCERRPRAYTTGAARLRPVRRQVEGRTEPGSAWQFHCRGDNQRLRSPADSDRPHCVWLWQHTPDHRRARQRRRQREAGLARALAELPELRDSVSRYCLG